jgi:tetratricopeptide (TPR) repeat protein
VSDVLSRELPAPRRWQELESIAFDVYGRLWKTTDAELHGRTGQPQAGVDVYGTNRVEQLFTGVQCKGKDSDYGGVLTEKELREEVEKALKFEPPLEAYVLLTTAPNDVAIQRVARAISAEHKAAGLFEVRVTGWDTFRHHLASHSDLLVKYYSDFAPVDVVGEIAAVGQQQARGFARIEDMLRVQNRFMTGPLDEQSGGDHLAERINEVSRLIGDGAPRAALKALDRIDADEGATASPLARYRLLASKGNAHLFMGEEAEAAALYREAHAAHPTFANAKATLAMAMLIEGDRSGAFDLAREAVADDTSSVRNASILIDTAPADLPTADLQTLLVPELLTDVDIRLRLAAHAGIAGEIALHKTLSEELFEAAPDDWRAMAQLAEALILPLNDVEGLALTHALPDDQVEAVERGTQLLSDAWAKLIGRDSTYQGRNVAANLINLLELAGREEEALAVLDEALVSNPTFPPLVVRAARRAAEAGDWPTVVQAIDALPGNEDITFDGLLMRTQAALALGHAQEALSLCDRLSAISARMPPQSERDDLVTALRVRARILEGADRAVSITEILDAYPASIVLRSIFFDELSDEDPLKTRLTTEIAALATANLSFHERVHAAETLYQAGQYSIAADLYAPLHGQADSHALRRRLQALLLADRRAEARSLFESLPKKLRSSPGYLNIGVNIYERVGLLKPGVELIELALAAEEKLHLRLGWIDLLDRLGQSDRYRTWLEQVPDTIDGSPSELIALARIIDLRIGRDPRSLAIGYRALRAGYGRAKIHLSYAIGLVISGRPALEQLSEPSLIAPGCGVELRNEETGELLFRLIETDPDPVIERAEIGPKDPFAQRLLGLKRGDVVEVEKIGTAPQQFRVINVQSRYLFAHFRTLRDFSTLFPGNTAFGSVEIDDSKGDAKFEPMFAMARSRAEYCRQIVGMYQEHPLPLAMVAKFTGASPFELWDGFSQDPTLGLKSAVGVEEEFASARKIAKQPGLVIVDPLSIYAWIQMGLSQIIVKCGARLAIVQSSIDFLRELVEERRGHRGTKMGSFAYDGQNYHMSELSSEALEAQIATAEAALELASSFLLVPAESETPILGRVDDFVEEFHPAYRDSLLAAAQANRALLTDDLGFRVIAQEVGAETTFTQALAQVGLAAQHIAHPDYRAVVGSLVDAHYAFTQFSPAELAGELFESNWSITPRLGAFAKLMTSPTLERGTIARVLAELLLNTHQTAPDVTAFAAFHVAFAQAMHMAGKDELLRSDYKKAGAILLATMSRNVARAFLKERLLRTTYLVPPIQLTADFREGAGRQLNRIWRDLEAGGFSLDGASNTSATSPAIT